MKFIQEVLPTVKNALPFAQIGAVGGFIAALFGGWSQAMNTLLILMAVDYVMGMMVAGIFHKSKKTKSGGFESRAGWKGLARKVCTVVLVMVGAQVDVLMGTSFWRDAFALAFCLNELISITENAGLMGIPIPAVLTQCVELLRQQADTTVKGAKK